MGLAIRAARNRRREPGTWSPRSSVSVAVAVAWLAGASTAAAQGSGPLDPSSWKAGDVHVHAGGDSSLLTNRMCRDDGVIDDPVPRSEEAVQANRCAAHVVDQVARAAGRAGLEWVI